jgi:NADH:ubiquinone oxidoreductase subunit 2 (subunit N)
MGLPPLSGFFSKYLVLSAAVSSGRLWLAAVFAAGAVLTILYLLRLFSRIFLGESRGKPPVAERSPLMVGVVVGLAALGLVCGLLIAFPAELAGSALGQMVGLAR